VFCLGYTHYRNAIQVAATLAIFKMRWKLKRTEDQTFVVR